MHYSNHVLYVFKEKFAFLIVLEIPCLFLKLVEPFFKPGGIATGLTQIANNFFQVKAQKRIGDVGK